MSLPELTTFTEAVQLARDARARGMGMLYVTINAHGRFVQSRSPVQAWRDVPGVAGVIVGRIVNSEDGVVEKLVLRVDVTDVMAAHLDLWVPSLGDPPPPVKRRPQFSSAR